MWFSFKMGCSVLSAFGEIQFIKSEFLVGPNSTRVEAMVERYHITNDKVQVKWKLISDIHCIGKNGSLIFDNLDDQQVIKLELNNITRNESFKIELFDPTNNYQIGEISEATIIFDCPDTKFMCQNGEKCIENQRRCNGYKDCSDGSDEVNCVKKCAVNEFKCYNGEKCIDGSWTCDGEKDCWDGSDEANCEEECTVNFSKCQNEQKCILNSWICDTEKDCFDGSDEENCHESTCKGFLCDSKQCVSCEFKCDGKRDCSDGSDENSCFVCKNGAVTREDYVCNNFDDCSDGSDEKDCQYKGNALII